MTTEPRLMTAEELQELPQNHMRHELVEGELHTMPPAGHEHGSLGYEFSLSLGNHVKANQLGKVYLAETGFIVSRKPDTVLAPDIAFVSTERLKLINRREGFFPGTPDLVVEVVSPSDRYSEVEEKVKLWLQYGTRMVIVVDPRTETLKVQRNLHDIQVLTKEDTLEVDDVIPGWTLSLAELFANL